VGEARRDVPVAGPPRDVSFFPHMFVILQILEGSCRSQATPDSRRLVSFASRGWRPTLDVDSQSGGALKN
jgi:hypothetical protein